MRCHYFNNQDLRIIGEALYIAEDVTGNFYRFSIAQWKKHRYDVKTLQSLTQNEISQNAFAMLNWCSRKVNDSDLKTNAHDFYFICLQDHMILNAITRDNNLGLLPILIYVFTHELIHIVRFCNFLQRANLSQSKRATEEKIVHKTTFEALKSVSIPTLDYVLDSYHGHRVCELAV